jgi:catechol 2,3-dioxygenase-like lactoylglutathione lyase family enzyme
MTGVRPLIEIHHVCIFARDIDRTVRFYQAAFGLAPVSEWTVADGADGQRFFGRGLMLSAGHSTFIEVFPATEGEEEQDFPLRGINHLSFGTTDCDDAYARAMAAGGQPYRVMRNGVDWDGRPMSMTVEAIPRITIKIAYMRGPDGEIIELYERLDK